MKSRGLVYFSLFVLSLPAWAATYTVTNTGDSGAGSFRQAILDTNTNVGADTIAFNIPDTDPGYDAAGGFWLITPEAQLPAVGDGTTTIDGSTQTTNQGNTNPNGPEIVIDGSLVSSAVGISLISSNNIVKNLVVNNFSAGGSPISYANDGGIVSSALLLYPAGILVFDSVTGNEIIGCYVGTDPAGATKEGNGVGIYLAQDSSQTTVGGSTAAERNIISGNDKDGVFIIKSTANVIKGNYIGTDRTGAVAVANGTSSFVYSGVRIGYISTSDLSFSNIIGGSSEGEGNLISGNISSGIDISGNEGNVYGNLIWGNKIGTDVLGTSALANGQGIKILRSSTNIIGGATAGARNIISGNGGQGVQIFSVTANSPSNSNEVVNNYIGVDVNGSNDLGNSHSNVSIGQWSLGTNYASYNIIGSNNVIANSSAQAPFTLGEGILIKGSGAVGNKVTQNSIFSNDDLGIRLQNSANQSIAAPVITQIATTPASTTVFGTATFEGAIEVYKALAGAGELSGEGFSFLGGGSADASGNWNITIASILTGEVTALVSDAVGNSSEFATNFSMTSATPATTTTTTTTTTVIGPTTTTTTTASPTTSTTTTVESSSTTTTTTSVTTTTTTTMRPEVFSDADTATINLAFSSAVPGAGILRIIDLGPPEREVATKTIYTVAAGENRINFDQKSNTGAMLPQGPYRWYLEVNGKYSSGGKMYLYRK